jgi:hypothetical protein
MSYAATLPRPYSAPAVLAGGLGRVRAAAARFRRFGVLLATVLVNGAHAVTTNLVSGIGGTVPKNIGWGTGVGTAAITDTTLFTEKLVDLSTSAGTDHTVGSVSRTTTTNTNDTFQVTGTRTATGAGTVTNAGTFDAASGGTLYIKGDFTGQALGVGDAIAFTINLKFS